MKELKKINDIWREEKLMIFKDLMSLSKMYSFNYNDFSEVKKTNEMNNNIFFGVYVIENLNELYIGQTTKGICRFDDHEAIKKILRFDEEAKIKIHFIKFSKSFINIDILLWCENKLINSLRNEGFEISNIRQEEPKLNDKNLQYATGAFKLINEYLKLVWITFELSDENHELDKLKIENNIFSYSDFLNSFKLNIIKTENGFRLLKKSKFNLETLKEVENIKHLSIKKVLKIVKDNIDENGEVVNNPLFKSPSGLSDLVSKKSTNGWYCFKNNKNQTLDEVYRNNK